MARPHLIRATCTVCGVVSLARGACNYSRCDACKVAGRLNARVLRERHPQGSQFAMGQVHLAVREGRLPDPKHLRCADCDEPATEYEHRDYSKPLTVDPICRSCNLKRGPAIPLPGFIDFALRRERPPYALRTHAVKLMRAMHLPTELFEACGKKLSVEDWRRIWPQVRPALPATTDRGG